VTIRLCGSGSGCVTILLMIMIRRYVITDFVVNSHLK
jgi:hypothetical protein